MTAPLRRFAEPSPHYFQWPPDPEVVKFLERRSRRRRPPSEIKAAKADSTRDWRAKRATEGIPERRDVEATVAWAAAQGTREAGRAVGQKGTQVGVDLLINGRLLIERSSACLQEWGCSEKIAHKAVRIFLAKAPPPQRRKLGKGFGANAAPETVGSQPEELRVLSFFTGPLTKLERSDLLAI
jgi:hypothetical protein